MAEINCHSEMTNFHRDNVTLQKAQQDEMRDRRDNGRIRLENGLTEAEKSQPKEKRSQGSYQMRTMVQDSANDYDIDDGTYFASDDLKDDDDNALTPLAARQRVCDALKWDGRLRKEATVRDNCVRQEYPAGYHIDVPVYRIVTTKNDKDEEVQTYELASGDKWVVSDARSVTRWFNGLVGELNAGESDGSQMRRIVKLSKKFSRRAKWKSKTLSGISITKLVVDHFVVDERDDKSLRETWKAIDAKLQSSTEIEHPISVNKLAEEGDAKSEYFRDCLQEALNDLEVLDNNDCTRKQARKSWDKVFDTTYFSNQPDVDEGPEAKGTAMQVTSVETARRNDAGGRFG